MRGTIKLTIISLIIMTIGACAPKSANNTQGDKCCAKETSCAKEAKGDCCKKEAKAACCETKAACGSEAAKACCANALKIVATVTIKNAADKAAVEQALFAVVDGTRTEEGSISYELHQDLSNPLVYVFVEVWKSQEAIDIHNASEHFKAFVAAVDGKVDLAVNTVKKVK